jgi:tetratricopeptide (TPR) repeat protein
VPIALLAAAEWGVRVAGLDPGDTPGFRMFREIVRNGEPCFQRNPHWNLPWHPPYREHKPEGRLRVACIGGSTVESFDHASFPRVLETLLRRALAPREVEVISAGFGGMYSDGELKVLRELIDRDLDCVVLYSLHNEFHPGNQRALLFEYTSPWRARLRGALGSFALGRLVLRSLTPSPTVEPSLADQVPDHRPIDGPEYRLIVQHFRENVESFAALCHERGVKLLLCTVAGNLREMPPFASVFARATGEQDRARWNALVDEAEESVAAGDPARALARLDEAEAIDGMPARLAYVRGQALLAVGRDAEARVALARARDTDGRINRAVSELNDVVRGFAGRPGVTVVDVETCFDERAPHGIAGHELIVDHLHPSVKGQGLIAACIVRALGDARLYTAPEELQRRGLHDPGAVIESLPEIGEMNVRGALGKLQLVLEKGRWDDTAQRAREELHAALRQEPKRVEVLVGLGLLEGLALQNVQSRAYFRQALELDADALQHWRERAQESVFIRSILNRARVLEEQPWPMVVEER